MTLRQNIPADLPAGRVGVDGSLNSTANAAAKLGHDLKAAHVPLAGGGAAGRRPPRVLDGQILHSTPHEEGRGQVVAHVDDLGV